MPADIDASALATFYSAVMQGMSAQAAAASYALISVLRTFPMLERGRSGQFEYYDQKWRFEPPDGRTC